MVNSFLHIFALDPNRSMSLPQQSMKRMDMTQIDKVLAVLRRYKRPMRTGEIAHAAYLPSAATARSLHTAAARGLVRRTDTGSGRGALASWEIIA